MNTLAFKRTIVWSVIALTAAMIVFSFSHRTFGAISSEGATVTTNTFRLYDFFASTTAATGAVSSTIVATSTSATSTNIATFLDTSGRYVDGSLPISGAKKVTLFFTRGGAFGAANTGTTTFSIQATPDGTNWYTFNKLVQATTTTVSNTVEQSIASIGATAPGNAATSTLVYSMDLSTEAWKAIRCITVTLVDGAASCSAYVVY